LSSKLYQGPQQSAMESQTVETANSDSVETATSGSDQAGGVESIPWSENVFMPDTAFKEGNLKRNNHNAIISGIGHVALLILFPSFLIPMSRSGVAVSTIIGIAYLGIFMCFLVHIFWIMFTAKNVYRIYTRCAVPDDWTGMGVAYANTQFKTTPIGSISEFCAIAGGVAKILLARLGSYAYTIIMVFIMIEGHKGTNFIVNFDLILECVGAIGCAMIGTFYDDPYSKGMKMGHYTGVCLGMCTHLGLLVQRVKDDNEYLWLPILFMVLTAVFFYLFWRRNSSSWTSDDPKAVTRYSIITLIFEASMLLLMTLSITVYFIMYGPL